MAPMDPKDFTQYLDEIATGYQRAQMLFTAVQGGVFGHLEAEQPADAVAEALGWSPRGTRMLLEGLVSLGLVEKRGAYFINAPIAAECLVPGAPRSQIHILTHKAHGWTAWSRLAEAVRTGTSVNTPNAERTEAERRAFICGMADIARDSARTLAAAIDLTGYRRLLDIGGGPATYAIELCKAYPGLEATVLDLPEVVPIAREGIEAGGLESRITVMAGDLRADPMPPGHDVMLLSNIIHSYSAEQNQALIRRCCEALEPGGLLLIKDFLMDADRTGPPFAQVFALHMLVHTESGDCYTVEDVADWTRAAGFVRGRRTDLTGQSRVWAARKPGRQ